jgi:hypothetical protein
MIKVGTTIRMRNVIIASFHSPSERRRCRKVDIWPAPNSAFSSGLGRHRPGPIELQAGRPRLPPWLTPLDRRFGDTVAVFRACCGRFRIQAGVASGMAIVRPVIVASRENPARERRQARTPLRRRRNRPNSPCSASGPANMDSWPGHNAMGTAFVAAHACCWCCGTCRIVAAKHRFRPAG